jgi:hypothetical protein
MPKGLLFDGLFETSKKEKPYLLDPNSSGMIEPGNIDLSYRPKVKNRIPGEGGYSTIRSLGFQDQDGNEVLIPTVVNGKVLSEDEAIENYYKTGKHLGKFKSPEDSTRYGEFLHNLEEKYRLPNGRLRSK